MYNKSVFDKFRLNRFISINFNYLLSSSLFKFQNSNINIYLTILCGDFTKRNICFIKYVN